MPSTRKCEGTIQRRDGVLTAKSTSIRSDEDVWFLIAESEAKKATCPRRSVGCVIVNVWGSTYVSGYNGAVQGIPSCMEEGCLIEGGHCVRAQHAEIRAITKAARLGLALEGCAAYCTLLPCINCLQALVACGIYRIFYDETYERSEKDALFEMAEKADIRLLERKRS